jgi:hypothetical protein
MNSDLRKNGDIPRLPQAGSVWEVTDFLTAVKISQGLSYGPTDRHAYLSGGKQHYHRDIGLNRVAERAALVANERVGYGLPVVSILEEEKLPLHLTAQLCGLLLLWRGLPPLGASSKGSTESKAERDLIMEMVSLPVRKNNCRA